MTKGSANKCSLNLFLGLCFRAGHPEPYVLDLKYNSLPFLGFEQCFWRGVVLCNACYLNWVRVFWRRSYIYTYIHIYRERNNYIYIHTHLHKYVYIYIYIVRTCRHTNKICMYIYIYIYTYTHACVRIYIACTVRATCTAC